MTTPEKSTRKLSIGVSDRVANMLDSEAQMQGVNAEELMRRGVVAAIVNANVTREASAHFEPNAELTFSLGISVSDGHTVRDFEIDPQAIMKGTPYVILRDTYPEA